MENFELTVRKFCRILEACNAEQRLLSNEVLETLGTFIEEILLASHITVFKPDTTNEKLLHVYQDLVDLFCHIQPEEEKKFIDYLTRLKEAKEDCLGRLHRTIKTCRDNLKVAEKELLGKTMKEEEMTDLLNFLTVTIGIIQGITKSNSSDSFLKRWEEKLKVHREPFSYKDEVIDVEEISKRNLGKVIVLCIGLEGVHERQGLRRLLQACIDYLQTKPEKVWKNASITIYNKGGKMYKIASGIEKHQFICQMENGVPSVRENTLVPEHKKPKPNHMLSADTKHFSFQKVEHFEQTVMNFCRTLEACSAEQQLVANEVLKTFITFVEEILLSFHLTVGSSDTVNVKKLLFQDLADLICHLQPGQNEKVYAYLTGLQEAKKDRISRLHRIVTMCKDNLQVIEKEMLQKKIKEQEKLDIMDFMTMTTNIIQGIMSNPNDSCLKILVERMKEHRETFSFQDEEMEVEEINKRNLGKMIVRYVGHEGVDEKPGLRRLLQACIDLLQTEAEGYWKNASITIYDEDDNMYIIASGTRKHQFICCMQNGEPSITKTKSVSMHKKPKPNHTLSTPSQKGCSIS